MNARATTNPSQNIWTADLSSGLVVFLVALPLCLGIALASNAPIVGGLLAGIVGGIVVGALSGSHTSVSGPAAGLTAVVASQIAILGSYEAFLAALIISGISQIIFGCLRMGFIAAFFPTSVIKGLLAAIGLLLVLKQLPHLFGWDPDYEGEMAFWQADNENTFSELAEMLINPHFGALAIGVLSMALLIFWNKSKWLEKSKFPPQLAVVIFGLVLCALFAESAFWMIESEHRVEVPIFQSLADLGNLFARPDFHAFLNLETYVAGLTMALVASLETLLNLEAIDKIDPKQRISPPNRELIAQGIGNLLLGFIGGLPVTSVIVRSSINISAKARSKNSAIFHGVLILVCVCTLPALLNSIPLSCLAAILIMTGAKLINANVIKEMWRHGLNQFIPFAVTVVAIIFSDPLIGVTIGLGTSFFFILHNNFKSPVRMIMEKRLDGETSRIVLGNQVSFLNKASISNVLDNLKPQSHIIFDATNTTYIDADVLALIEDFKEESAPVREISVSLIGFKPVYNIEDQILFAEHSTMALRESLSPAQIVQFIKDGNERVRDGYRLKRDLTRQIEATSNGQFPLAAILSCIDSRSPAELVFDLGIGDIFSIRMAGNIVSEKVLGSLEFACAIAGAKLIVVMGHTRCGAISAALELHRSPASADIFECAYLAPILHDIKTVIERCSISNIPEKGHTVRDEMEELVVRENVLQSIECIKKSAVLARLLAQGEIAIIGCTYDVNTGHVEFLSDTPSSLNDQRLEI